jgi:hypothetical protein
MERLQDSLRRRDVFVSKSERWGDPRIKLLQGAQWETVRPQVCRALGRRESPEPELNALAQQLDAAYQRTASNFASNDAVRNELPRSKLRGINPPLADSYGPPVWRGKAGVSCVGSACEP